MRLGVQALLLSPLLILPSAAVETRSSSSRPRGVSPEHAKFYKSGSTDDTFTCISNPSISIPFSRVNDDFCDCPDGSDEPGTAACSSISPLSPPQYGPGPDISGGQAINSTLALPGFYCKNKGHIPAYLPFESVNDGRCDYDVCCDGSDEWAAVGGTKCEDRCKQIGAEHRKSEEIRLKSLRGALKRRKELGTAAARMRKEAELLISDLEVEIQAGEVKVKQAEENLVQVEKREKLKIVRGDGKGKTGGKLGVLVGLSKNRVTELRTALEKTRKQRDAMVARVTELEDLLLALKTDYNPNFNDEGVKVAVRGWEDYAARETDDVWSEDEDRDLTAILAEDSDSNGINWAEFEEVEPESDVDALYQVASYLPAPLQAWIDGKVSAIRRILVENGVLPDKSTSGSGEASENKAIKEAKKAVSDAEKSLSDDRLLLDKRKQELEKDYGPDDVFRALVGRCIEKDSGEYTYELCFLTQTKQKSKKGGAHTSLGNFAGFETEQVDEVLPKDGKGLGKGERIVLKYENGQHCWNGPNRSARVVLACSENDEIWKVSESEKCVYRIEAGTAAACGWRDGNEENVKPEQDSKDEL
ncbi:hypothetical protein DV738_g2025, partial [Chaetothyriales sp. CBS 135597]